MKRVLILASLFIAAAARAEIKNVKLLTGMTEPQLVQTMDMMRASLGVNCDYCHVTGEKWDMASDAKPPKNRARDMIRMVMEMNRTTFGGQAVVSCYTCHRGSLHPVTLVALPQAAPPFPTPIPEKPSLPDAKTLVSRYATLLGDTSRLTTTKIMKGDRIPTRGPISIFEITQKGSKIHTMTTTAVQNVEQAFNGTHGWIRSAEGLRPYTPNEDERAHGLIEYWGMVLPADIGADAKTTARESIDGRDVWVVEQPNRRFYFDVESGLLKRVVRLTPTLAGTWPEQTDYDDYRDVEGTKVPFRVRVSVADTLTSATRQYSSVKLGVPVDDAKFEVPK